MDIELRDEMVRQISLCTGCDILQAQHCVEGIMGWMVRRATPKRANGAEQAKVVTTGCVRCDFLRTFFRKDNMLCEVHRE